MGKYRVTRFFPIGFLVDLTILENFTIGGFLVVSEMPGVKGKSTPRKPPRSPKKLSKSQKIAKKLKQWNNLCKRVHRAKNYSDVSTKCLEVSQSGMKSAIKKCNNTKFQKKSWYF